MSKPRCRHACALVIVASPAPGVFAIRWCPECGALYNSRYRESRPGGAGWSERREWNSPGGSGARAYVKLVKSVRAQRHIGFDKAGRIVRPAKRPA